MSAIPSFLSPDASSPSRATSLRSRPDATGAAGQPPKFADFLTASVVVPPPGGDTGMPIDAKTSAKPAAGAIDGAATPEAPMAALPGNSLPTPAPSLPVMPAVRADSPSAVPVTAEVVAGEPVSAAPVAAGAVTVTPLATRSVAKAMPSDGAPRPDKLIQTAADDEPTGDTDTPSDPLATKDDDEPGNAPGPAIATPILPDAAVIPFAIAPTPGATPDAAPTPAILPAARATTGPVAASRVFASLRQATADTSSLGLVPTPSAGPMVAAMPSSAGTPSIALPAMPDAAATGPATPMTTTANPAPSANMPAFRLVAMPVATTPETAPPPLTTLPSGPLSVTQPAQATATIGLLAGALRGAATPVRDEDPLDDPARPTTAAIDPAALAATDLTPPVASASAPDQPPLDMTQAHWPQGMIERIDRMREDAATADTRIQLSPDALGGIAVAIRQDDGATHIHFTADHAGTAAMLADAQGQLTRLAEDKGMRLGDVAVASGSTGGGMAGGSDMGQSLRDQRPPAQPAPVIPSRPRGSGTSLFGEESVGSSPTASPSTPSIRIA